MDHADLPSTPTPQRLAARYGSPSEHRLRRVAAVAGLACCLAGLVAWWLWVSLLHSDPAVRFDVTGFHAVTDTSVTIDWVVQREPGSVVDCVLRARNEAGVEVGRLRVAVPATASPPVVMRQRLKTSERPVTGEVLTCLESAG